MREGPGKPVAGGDVDGEERVVVGIVDVPRAVAGGELQRGARLVVGGEAGEAVAVDLVVVGGVCEEEEGTAAALKELADDLHVAQHVAGQDGDGWERVGVV